MKIVVCIIAIVMAAGIAINQEGAVKTKSEKAEDMVMTGSCHCGKVAYKVTGPIVKCSPCKCRGCQKATGTLEAQFVTVMQKDFSLLKGKLSSFKSSSKAQCDVHGTWFFCPHCGSHIYWKPSKSEQFDIFAGTLDDTSLYKPESKE